LDKDDGDDLAVTNQHAVGHQLKPALQSNCQASDNATQKHSSETQNESILSKTQYSLYVGSVLGGMTPK